MCIRDSIRTFRRGGQLVIQPFATVKWPLAAVFEFANKVLNLEWAPIIAKLTRGEVTHLALEKATKPFHAVVAYLLQPFGDAATTAFKEGAAIVDRARDHELPAHALARMLEACYVPWLQELHLAITRHRR